MKRRYVFPCEVIIPLHLKQLVANSQTKQSVYTDTSVTTSAALVKELDDINIWDNEW